MKKKNLVAGALILTAAGLFTRVLGFIYRIYMSNLIGSEGMGLFQLIFPIYMLVWTLSASGLSVTVSKLTAQENAKRQYGSMHRILKLSILLSGTLGFLFSLLVFIFADWISIVLLKDPRPALALRYLAPCLPFMAIGSCIRGYFYGLQDTVKPACAQVLEQVARMAVIYFTAGFFIPKGLSYACAAAALGISSGEILSFLYVYYSYAKHHQQLKCIPRPALGILATFHTVMTMAVPLTANRAITTLLQTVENILIPRQLQLFGLSPREAISMYGELTGMALPLIFFPSAFIISLAMTLIPAVSEASAVKNMKRITYTVSKALKFTAIIGIGAVCLFFTFSHELGMAIYNKPEVGKLLYAISWLCPLLYLQLTLTAILNGLGQQMVTFRHNVLGSLINILFVFFLIPVYGLKAFFWGVLLSLTITSVLNLQKVLRCTGLVFDLGNWVIKPALSAGASGLTIYYISLKIFFPTLSLAWGTTLSILSLGGMYFIFLFLMGCITKEDMKIVKRSVA